SIIAAAAAIPPSVPRLLNILVPSSVGSAPSMPCPASRGLLIRLAVDAEAGVPSPHRPAPAAGAARPAAPPTRRRRRSHGPSPGQARVTDTVTVPPETFSLAECAPSA